jgi:putative membrane protein
MKNYQNLFVLLLIVLVTGFTACQRTHDQSVEAAREGFSEGDRDVATKIEESHLGELDLARLAEERASNGDVKDFAGMLEDDHQKALNDVADLLKDRNVSTGSQSKPATAQTQLSELQKMSGAQFDREFMSMMVQNHQKTLADLNQAQSSVQNEDLKDYINNLIPKVQKHLEKAQELQTKI